MSILPPIPKILFFSSIKSGLWSSLNGVTVTYKFPSASSMTVAIIALESPAFAQCIDVPSKQTVQTVDPLSLRSI